MGSVEFTLEEPAFAVYSTFALGEAEAGKGRTMRLAAAILTVGVACGVVGCAVGCPAALLDGDLVAHGQSGLAVKEATGGFVREVIWPFGYGVRPDGDRLALTDLFGTVVAHEGDHVQLPGGETSSDGSWGACGVIAVEPGE